MQYNPDILDALLDDDGQYRATYHVDLCLCIDKTGSMKPIMDTVKANAMNLYNDIVNAMSAKAKVIDRFRIRVIWFGDYLADEEPMVLYPFMDMPEEMEDYRDAVSSMKPYGGGDAPEDGLEALAYAIRSPWCTTGVKRRHIIVMFTDAPAHDLGFGKADPNYPKSGEMPDSLGKLTEMWGFKDRPGEMENAAKRLILFAPDEGNWHTIRAGWNNVVLQPVTRDKGLREISYQAVLDGIANSI